MSDQVKDYGEVLTFFVIEALAFVSFTLGNNIILFLLYGFLSLAAILAFNYKSLKDLNWRKYLIFIIPLFLFAVLTAISNFFRINLNILSNVSIFLAMMLFISLGYMVTSIKSFKMINGLLTIYAGIAILVIISLVYSMIIYVPFYPLIFEGKYIYFEGSRFPIWTSTKLLMGFSFMDVSIEYFQLFATLLFTSAVGLKFVSFKKEPKKFIIICLFSLIGLLAMLFTLNKTNIVTDILVILFLTFVLFIPKNKKVLSIFGYCLLGIVVILGGLFFVNSQSQWGFAKPLQDLISNNFILNKLFNANRFSASFKEALDGCLSSNRLLGFDADSDLLPTGSWLFDNIMTSGILGALSFLSFVVLISINLVKYYQKDGDDNLTKNLIVCFVGTFFIYGVFALDAQPYAHYLNFIVLQQNPMLLIVLFLCGYTFKIYNQKVEMKKEDNIDEKVAA